MSEPQIGQVLTFGWRKTPNVVTAIKFQCAQGWVVALRGPRGGKSMALITSNGSARKFS